MPDSTEYAAPHCNPEVLHPPGTCWACDLFPDRQAQRAASGTPYTPAAANGWPGNVAQPDRSEPQPFEDWGRADRPCTVQQPRGWRCTRRAHPTGTPCASVPRWWNLRWRLFMGTYL